MIKGKLVKSDNFYLNPLNKSIVDETLKGKDFTREILLGEKSVNLAYESTWPASILNSFLEFSRTFDDEIIGNMEIIHIKESKAIGVVGVKYEAPDVSDLKMVEFNIDILDAYKAKESLRELVHAYVDFMKENSSFDRLFIKLDPEVGSNKLLKEVILDEGFISKGLLEEKKGKFKGKKMEGFIISIENM